MSLSVVPEELALLLNSSVPGHVKLPESTSSGSRVWLPFFCGKTLVSKGFKVSHFPKRSSRQNKEQERASSDPFYQLFLTYTHVSLCRADEK